MEETVLLTPPVPAPRKCRLTIKKPEYEIEQKTKRLPRSIPYSILDDNIIWLDLWANERSLTFADEMIASNKLFIFDTAVDCTDFLDLSSFQTNYSIILSGIYALNRKVIDQLLLHSFVNQICLILPESCYGNIPDQLNFNRKVNVIYNNDPILVMYWLCTDYSNFETFVQHNKELHAKTSDVSNDVLQENVKPMIVRSYRWDVNHNSMLTSLRTNDDFKYKRSVASYTANENILTNNIRSSTNHIKENKFYGTTDNTLSNNNYVRRQNNERFSVKSKPSVVPLRSRSYEKINLIELPLPSTSQDSSDVHARKELEQINEVSTFFFFSISSTIEYKTI